MSAFRRQQQKVRKRYSSDWSRHKLRLKRLRRTEHVNKPASIAGSQNNDKFQKRSRELQATLEFQARIERETFRNTRLNTGDTFRLRSLPAPSLQSAPSVIVKRNNTESVHFPENTQLVTEREFYQNKNCVRKMWYSAAQIYSFHH